MPQATLRSRREIMDAEWDAFVCASPQCSAYAQSWYLDAVCPGWSAIVVEEEGVWQAVMPLPISQKMGVQYSLQPAFTQHLGLLTRVEEKGKGRIFSALKAVQEAALSAIPPAVKRFHHNFHPSLQYLLPFHWAGYALGTRYTYWLDLSQGMEAVQARYTKGVRSDLTRAAREGIEVKQGKKLDALAAMMKAKGLLGQGEEKALHRLWKSATERGHTLLLEAYRQDGALLCAAGFICFQGRMTYLLSAAGDQPRLGSNTLLLHKAFEWGVAHGHQTFDFEGSMLEPVEEYFRGFNPDLHLYLQVTADHLPAVMKWGYAASKKLRKR